MPKGKDLPEETEDPNGALLEMCSCSQSVATSLKSRHNEMLYLRFFASRYLSEQGTDAGRQVTTRERL